MELILQDMCDVCGDTDNVRRQKRPVGPKSVDDAFYILNSDGCQAAMWLLYTILNQGQIIMVLKIPRLVFTHESI